MGIGRMLWRSTRIGRTIDTIKNIVDEGNLVEGVKRTVKEDYCEDNPLTSAIYKSGKYDGKIEGYEEASYEYEKKLLTQADEFLNQTRIFEIEKDAYEQLLDEYEKEIDELSEKVNRTEAENQYLHQLLLRDRKLRKMAC
ncbi:hypothetical protein [Clostridium paridis]|uniref:Uncharacterized protein n=1 Tax=Clostridium paridis TaxID=2803863 RepID=A0A937FJM2_9CLOT|nr:hypothetical protein [Clostridium paridis]MBL4932766.1 hypothetical protein [Clostridium paridis]